MEAYAEEIDGRYSEYDHITSVVIVPLDESRFQTVYGYNLEEGGYVFTSKICNMDQDIPYEDLVYDQDKLNHTRFVVREEQLLAKGHAFPGSCNEPLLKDIIQEVANVADRWEYRLTGQDVH